MWEHCVDHDLDAGDIATINSLYSKSLEYPGANYKYFRSRMTVITNSNSALVGQSRTDGPAWGSYPVNGVFTTGTRSWLGSSAFGLPQTGWTFGEIYTAYNLMMFKPGADPTFWIGAADELRPPSQCQP